MNHERKLFVKEHEGEQCNGFRSRRWYSHGFEFYLRFPRSRSGNFYPILLGFIRRKQRPCKVIQSTLQQRSYHLSVSSLYIQKRESN